MTKIWAGSRNEARVEPSELAVLDQLHVESNSECSPTVSVVDISVPHSQIHTLTSTYSGHTYTYFTQGMMQI